MPNKKEVSNDLNRASIPISIKLSDESAFQNIKIFKIQIA